jgi:hypothetical protein
VHGATGLNVNPEQAAAERERAPATGLVGGVGSDPGARLARPFPACGFFGWNFLCAGGCAGAAVGLTDILGQFGCKQARVSQEDLVAVAP